MTVNVTDAKANFVQGAGTAGTRYAKKVSSNTTWHDNASSANAESLWAQAVQAAAAVQRRAKAVSQVSQSTWQQAASTIGAQRIGPGMTAKADKWAANFGPYAPVIDSAVASMPPRGIGAQANIARVLAIDVALESKKKELKG
jgi:hypothetical protein